MKVAFKIGDRIELTHSKSATGQKLSERKFGSQLLDFDGVRTAKIAMPILESRVIPLEVGEFRFVSVSGKNPQALFGEQHARNGSFVFN